MKKNEEEGTYPFGWLDELAEKTLNPEYAPPSAPESPVLKKIEQQLDTELTAIYLGLKKRAFLLFTRNAILIVVWFPYFLQLFRWDNCQ